MKDLTSSLSDTENVRTRIIVAPVHPKAQVHVVDLIKHLNPEAEVITLAMPTTAPSADPSTESDVTQPEPQQNAPAASGVDLSRLSPRQREVLELLVDGSTNKEIARHLGISPSTVRVHVSALLRTLDVPSRTAAAAAFAASSISASENSEKPHSAA